MMRSRLLWKLYCGYVVAILLTTGAVGALVSRTIERDAIEGMREALEAEAFMLREIARIWMGSHSDGGFQDKLRKLGAETGTRLTVIDADGRVLADSSEDPARMDRIGTRPEFVQAARDEGGIGQATRFSHTTGQDMMYVAVAVQEGGETIGQVRTSVPLSAVEDQLAGLRGTVVLGAAIGAVLALVLGFVVAGRISGPLASMTAGAEAIAKGDYHRRVGSTSSDEIGKLARAFDGMAEQLEERVETITRDRNKLLAILGGMVEGVVAVSRDARVVHMNVAAAKILGANPTAASGRPIWEVTRMRDVADTLVRAAKGGDEVKKEVQLVRPGSERIIETYASPLRDSEGNPAGAVMVLHDVSDLRKLETVRSEFVANASHELKTPITAIRGLVDTLVQDTEIDPSTRQRFLEKVRNQSERLSSLVRDLLTLSRLESGAGTATEAIDLRGPVEQSVRALGAAADEKGLTVTSDAPARPVTVVGSPETVREIVDNLVDNAIKYTSPSGRIAVRLLTDGAWAVLEVEDDGIGIDPVEHGRIFERFYRVDRGRSRDLGGTGLGLSIVKHAALRLGGVVSVRSAPGRGSTFTVRLPLASGCA